MKNPFDDRKSFKLCFMINIDLRKISFFLSSTEVFVLFFIRVNFSTETFLPTLSFEPDYLNMLIV